MIFRLSSLIPCLLTLALGCDAEPEPMGEIGGASGEADTSDTNDSAPPQCAEGYEPIAEQGECFADAGCYELPDGSWCTGLCPEGSSLGESDPPQCVPDEPAADCAQGFEPIADDGECFADAGCYELPDGSWCTGACPAGQQLDDSVPRRCVDAPFGGCLPGFEFVDDESSCIADAVCYEVVPYGWCTGECPDGGEFTLSESGPSCV